MWNFSFISMEYIYTQRGNPLFKIITSVWIRLWLVPYELEWWWVAFRATSEHLKNERSHRFWIWKIIFDVSEATRTSSSHIRGCAGWCGGWWCGLWTKCVRCNMLSLHISILYEYIPECQNARILKMQTMLMMYSEDAADAENWRWWWWRGKKGAGWGFDFFKFFFVVLFKNLRF